MKLSPQDRFAAGAFAVQGLLGLAIWRFGEAGPLPMHYGLSGQVNRWGDRTEVAVTELGMALTLGALYALLPVLASPRASTGGGRAVPAARWLLLAISLCTSLLMAATGFGLMGAGRSPLPVLAAFASLVLLAIGVWLGKVEPNPFVGVRTYWSLRSRLAWDKSNRLLGRIAFWAGLAGFVSFPIAPQPLGLELLLGALGLGAIAAIYESWRVWRDDPDAGAA